MAVAHKSAISVGLIYVPVSLYKSTRDTSISFNQLTKDTNERIRYKKFCPNCKEEVPPNNIVKGYEYEKGKYVVITEDELDKIKTKKDKTIHILHFAKMSDIDNIYYEKNYYVIPEPGGEKAYELLRHSMLKEEKVAVAKTVMGTKEELIVLYPTIDTIIAKILFYQEEIQAVPIAGMRPPADDGELEMAKVLINTMTKTFEPSQYRDEYQAKLREAIESKIKGQEIVTSDTSQPGNVINLMEALQKTIEQSQNRVG